MDDKNTVKSTVSMDEFLSDASLKEELPEMPELKTPKSTDSLDVDLTSVTTQLKKEQPKIPLTKEEKKAEIKLHGSIKDIFKKGIIGKLELGIASVSPEMPLTQAEKDAMSLDLDLLLMSPDLMKNITKIPLWIGITMLIITIIFMIITRIMPFFQKEETEDTSVKPKEEAKTSQPKELPIIEPKKTTKKKKGAKGSSVK